MSDRPPIESAITPLISMLNIGGQIFCRALTRVTLSGAVDEIPRNGPLIIAANHASNLDAVVLGSWIVPKLGRRSDGKGKVVKEKLKVAIGAVRPCRRTIFNRQIVAPVAVGGFHIRGALKQEGKQKSRDDEQQ